MESYDVVVVGAGIAGAAAAHGCAERGARVLLLDRGEPGGQASGAAAGMLAPCSEAAEAGAFLDAGRESLRLWPELAERLREQARVDCELVLDGLLRIAATEEEAAVLRGRVAWQRELGADAGWLSPEALGGVEPALAGGHHGAARYPGEGHVHSPRAVRAFVEATRRLGGEVRRGVEVAGADAAGRLLLAGEPPVAAGTVVVAAGVWSGRVAAALGAQTALPVRPVRGQLVALRGLPRLPRHVVFGGRLGYAVAKRDGLLLVGSTEEDAGFDCRVTADATERLLGTARALVRGAGDSTLAHAWAGLRPAAPDALPLLGELDTPRHAPRLLAATGHFRNGVLLAPLTGRAIASLVLDGAVSPLIAPFDPRRFG